MNEYEITATTRKGQPIKETVEAESQNQACQALRQKYGRLSWGSITCLSHNGDRMPDRRRVQADEFDYDEDALVEKKFPQKGQA